MIIANVKNSDDRLQFYRKGDKLPAQSLVINSQFRDITIHKISGSSLSMMVFVFEKDKIQIIIENSIQTNILACVGNILKDLIDKNNQLIAGCKKGNITFKSIKENIGMGSL